MKYRYPARTQRGFTLTSLLIVLFIIGALVVAAQRMGGSSGITTSEVGEATAMNVLLANGEKMKNLAQVMAQNSSKAVITDADTGADGFFSAVGGRATRQTEDSALFEPGTDPADMRWHVGHFNLPGVSRVLDAVAGTYDPSVTAYLPYIKASICQALNAKLLKNDPDNYDETILSVGALTTDITLQSATPSPGALVGEAGPFRPAQCIKTQDDIHVMLYTLEP